MSAPAGAPAPLTRDEAARRAALVTVRGYEIDENRADLARALRARELDGPD